MGLIISGCSLFFGECGGGDGSRPAFSGPAYDSPRLKEARPPDTPRGGASGSLGDAPPIPRRRWRGGNTREDKDSSTLLSAYVQSERVANTRTTRGTCGPFNMEGKVALVTSPAGSLAGSAVRPLPARSSPSPSIGSLRTSARGGARSGPSAKEKGGPKQPARSLSGSAKDPRPDRPTYAHDARSGTPGPILLRVTGLVVRVSGLRPVRVSRMKGRTSCCPSPILSWELQDARRCV